MASRRLLRSGMPAVYTDNRTRKARWCVEHYRALGARYGLSDDLARSLATGVADAWASWRAIKRELSDLEDKRERGRGRRPNGQAVERLRRREGLQWQKYEQSLARLEELVGPRRPLDIARQFAQLHREQGSAP